MSHNLKNKILAVFLTLLVSLPGSIPVQAQSLPFGIKPENPQISTFTFTLAAGESIADAIIVKSNAGEDLQMIVEPVTGINAESGGITFDFGVNSGPGQWISMESEETFIIKPFHTQRIPFTVTVPAGTPPGEYVAGFLAGANSITPTETPSAGMTVNVVTRMGVVIIIHVPGPEQCDVQVEELKTSVMNGQWLMNINLINKGNVPFAGIGKIQILPLNVENSTQQKDWQIRYFIAGSKLTANIYFEIPQEGDYNVVLSVADSKKPACKLEYTEKITFGESEKLTYATQATILAEMHAPTETPTISPQSTSQVMDQVKQPGTTYWYIWISLVVLLISVGLVIYAMALLKKSKK